MSEAKTPFQRVTDDLTGGCGCGCHTGIGYRTACDHCAAVPETKPEPTTLGEYIERRTSGDNTLLRRILYGTDEPCPVCDGTGYDPPAHPCLSCHGSGRLKTPGLGDSLKRAFLCGDGTYDGFAVERLLEAIRREIGEAP
jgi:RecJ-like exonuclease